MNEKHRKRSIFWGIILLAATWFSVSAGDSLHPALLDPSLAKEEAPASYRVKFDTTKGSFIIKVTREWSPRGADRFYNLVKIGYFKDVAFYRVIDGFMAQFGFSGDPEINQAWSGHTIRDDLVKASNTAGRISFAKTNAPHSRSTQFFINTVDNTKLDQMGFAAFGEVEGDGLDVVKSLYNGYGEGAPYGKGPHQGKIKEHGIAYLKYEFPDLDYILKAEILQ